jgi:integrase
MARAAGDFGDPEGERGRPVLLGGAAKGRYGGRGRPLIGVLAVGGLRISEALALRWRDVSLARAELVVRRSKTEAGERVVILPPSLVEELVEWKTRTRFSAPTDLVFSTSQGKQDSRSNVTRRLLRPVVEKANVELGKAGISTIDALTLHGCGGAQRSSLRRLVRPHPRRPGSSGTETRRSRPASTWSR